MTDDRPDAPDEGSNADDERGGILGSVRKFLELLQEMDREGDPVRHGRVSSVSGRTQADYTVAIGSLESRIDEADGVRDGSDTGEFERRVDQTSPVDVRETADGVLVHVEIPEVEGETISAGVDERTLVLGVDDTILRRISLPRSGLTVIAGAYRNGVLELHLEADPPNHD